MAVVSVERVQVICDHCHLPALDLLGRPQVWSTSEKAAADLTERGWNLTGTGVTCGDCATCLPPTSTPEGRVMASTNRWLRALPAC